MAKFLFYLEEDVQDADLEFALQRGGMVVFRSGTEGMNGRSDADQLAFAATRGWVLYTANVRDFAVLHRDYIETGRVHAGLVFRFHQQYGVGEQARRILRIWQTLSAEEMVNRYEALSQWGDERP